MKSSPTVFAVLILFHVTTQADSLRSDDYISEPSSTRATQLSSSIEPATERTTKEMPFSLQKSFSVRLYKAPELKKVMTEQELAEVQSGVVLDYFPFANGFHVSAGTFKEEKELSRSSDLYGNGRAYIGVGWKKLLDDAQRLDLNIDVGAYIESTESDVEINNSGQKTAEGAAVLSSGSVGIQEQPVVRFGLEYRF